MQKSTQRQRLRPQSFYRLLLISLVLMVLFACRSQNWQLIDIRNHMPDLEFALTNDRGQAVTAQTYQGKVTLLYFGYTNCPDVCPATLGRLTQVMQQLGDHAQDVRILFISVDPARDTATSMHSYISAFDSQHIVGLTGTKKQIKALAKHYRVAYQLEKPREDKSYDVTHGSAVYIFDRAGHARLMATLTDTAERIAHDVNILVRQ
jgi:protein SCO1